MAAMGFILIATETMPAGLLPQISAGLDITEGTAGQLVSVYALGTIAATMPGAGDRLGRHALPVVMTGLAALALVVAVTGRRTAFPATP